MRYTIILILMLTIFLAYENLHSQEKKHHDFGVKILSPGVYLDYQFSNKFYVNAELGYIFGYNYTINQEDRHDRGDFHFQHIKISPRYNITKLMYLGAQVKYAFPFKKYTESFSLYSVLGIRKEWKRVFLDFYTGYGVHKNYDLNIKTDFYQVLSTGLGLGIKLIDFD